jgi:dienelactone hydrolase
MEALIYYPRLARPPYRAIVFFPGSGAQWQRSSDLPRDSAVIEALLGTGRTIVYPVLAGTYERGPRPRTGQIGQREWVIHVVQDVRRTIDYLETRDDFAADQIAYVGLSWGAQWGPIVTAVESRLRANVFIGGGLPRGKELDEVDPFNFAPHVTAPTLMINGRQDSLFPFDVSSEPMFQALGLPPDRKRHVLVDGGHLIPVPTAIAEIRAWLDQYVGPVNEAEKHR